MIDAVGFTMFRLVLENEGRQDRGDSCWRIDPLRWLAALAKVEDQALNSRDLILRPNTGRGDCLFHALAGRDLFDGDVRDVRHQLAGRIMRMRSAPRANGRRVIAALLQTPQTRKFGIALARSGVQGLRNNVMAALASVRGIYAGELELRQWCAVSGERVLIAEASGRFCEIGPRGATEHDPLSGSRLEPLRSALSAGRIVLFKSPGHWQRVVGVAGA